MTRRRQPRKWEFGLTRIFFFADIDARKIIGARAVWHACDSASVSLHVHNIRTSDLGTKLYGSAVEVGLAAGSCFGSGSCGFPSPGPRHSWKRLLSSSPWVLHHDSSNCSAFLKLSGAVGRKSVISTLMTGCLPTSWSADLRIGPYAMSCAWAASRAGSEANTIKRLAPSL